MERTAQLNAHEFGALTKQGKDFRLAVLVACSVERGLGNGRPSTITPTNVGVIGKVSAGSFARISGSTDKRILRHLTVWDRIADRGLVDQAADLSPEDAGDDWDIEQKVKDAFETEFKSLTDQDPTGGRPRDGKPRDAAKIIEKRGAKAVVDELTSQQRAELATAIERRSIEDIHEAAVARGGHVPNSEPDTSPIGAVIQQAEQWARCKKSEKQFLADATAYGMVASDGPEAQDWRMVALTLMDLIQQTVPADLDVTR